MQKSLGILCFSNQCAYKCEKPQNAIYAVRKYIDENPREVFDLLQAFLYLDRTVLTHTLISPHSLFIKNVLCIKHHKNCVTSLKIASIFIWLSKKPIIFLGPQICYDNNLLLDVPSCCQ